MLRAAIFWLSHQPRVTGAIAQRGMRNGFARRFVPGETVAEALTASRELNRLGRHVSLNLLGEYVSTRTEAQTARDAYLDLLRQLEAAGIAGNLSIKLTQIGLKLDLTLCRNLAGEVAAAARSLGRTVEMDMEGSADTDATLEVYAATQRAYGNVTVAIQAYLHRSTRDLERLAPLAPSIRLVKGAYREPASIALQHTDEVDANYCRLLDQLLAGPFRAAIATQDPEMVRYARQAIAEHAVPRERYEFQMMYGIRRDLQQQLVSDGFPLRIYVPFGAAWCPYFMRRLAERPANCWFVLRSLLAESLGRRPQSSAAV